MARTATRDTMARQYSFAQVPTVQIPRSTFNRSHTHKTSFDAGYLIPFFVDEALPGDTFNLRGHYFARLATPIYPIMDNFYLDTFYFAVPYRLVWDNWKKFNGEQVNPGDSVSFQCPQIAATTVGPGTVFDYMGIPVNIVTPLSGFQAMPFRALNLIYNEWFRDENLTPSVSVPKGDGPDSNVLYTLRRRCKRHDYFSSCLPFVQKGTAVTVPLGITAPVTGGTITGSSAPTFNVTGASGARGLGTEATAGNDPQNPVIWSGTPFTGVNQPGPFTWAAPGLTLTGASVDLTGATALTINDLRLGFQTQRMLERDARGGTRYTEIIRSHFGVISPDQRQQRPEYLGGGSQRINVTAVPNTASLVIPPTAPRQAIGSLSGFGTVAGVSGFVKSFTEHCWVIGLVNVRADVTYQQGLERFWSRKTRLEHYWPSLAHLGEQAVLSKEIFMDGTAGDADVFGYQERYAEYRYKPNRVSGRLRSGQNNPALDSWHLALDFGTTRPVLNTTFIEDNPPFARVIAISTEPHFILDAYFDYKCARPMPLYSVPGLIDHF